MIENKNQSKTDLAQLGKFGLLEHLTKNLELVQESTLKGIGEDAAVLSFENQKTVVSTELLIEGVHFDLAYTPLKHLGYKAVVSVVSKICAMNATPTQISFFLAVSNRFSLEALEELYAGIELACTYYNIDIVGADTTTSQKGLTISMTALGKTEEDELIYRSNAQDTDLLVLSGDIGSAYMGLQVLEREKQVFLVNQNNQPDLERYDYLIQRQLKPEARVDLKKLLADLNLKPTAMTLVSDGLASEIMHLCTQSKVGCNVYEDKLPLDPQLINTCEEFNIDSTTIAINAGEDYELLFTIKMADFEKIKGNPDLSIIGHITPEREGIHLITRANTKLPLKAQGWNFLKEYAE